jgi:hypothetical protein
MVAKRLVEATPTNHRPPIGTLPRDLGEHQLSEAVAKSHHCFLGALDIVRIVPKPTGYAVRGSNHMAWRQSSTKPRVELAPLMHAYAERRL